MSDPITEGTEIVRPLNYDGGDDAPKYITDEAELLDQVLAAIKENTRVQQETQRMVVEGLSALGALTEDLTGLLHPADGSSMNVGKMVTGLLFGK